MNDAAAAAQLGDGIAADRLGACGQDTTRPSSLPRLPASGEQPSLIRHGPRKQFLCLHDTP